MRILFEDVCKGLKLQGYKEQGGSDIFRIFEKDKEGIKVYIKGMYAITVRYYYKDEEE